MHGPANVAAMYGHASQVFGAPMVISSRAKSDYPNNQINQYCESYIDEAESTVPNDNGVLTAWVKISQGADGEWAYHLGQLQASIETLKLKHCTPAILNVADSLAKHAPSGTPQDIVSALKLVAHDNNSKHINQKDIDILLNAVGNSYGW
jgi:hypothetical protein